jgi:hypothetical protein
LDYFGIACHKINDDRTLDKYAIGFAAVGRVHENGWDFEDTYAGQYKLKHSSTYNPATATTDFENNFRMDFNWDDWNILAKPARFTLNQTKLTVTGLAENGIHREWPKQNVNFKCFSYISQTAFDDKFSFASFTPSTIINTTFEECVSAVEIDTYFK